MISRRHGLIQLVTLVGLVAACGGAGGSAPLASVPAPPAVAETDVQSIQDIRASLVCVEDPNLHVDWVPMPIALSEVARWLEVTSLDSLEPRVEGDSTLFDLHVKESEFTEPVATSLHIWPNAVPRLSEALTLRDQGAIVFLGAGSTADPEPNMIDAFVIFVVDEEGFSFLGECDAVRSNAEMESTYGEGARDVLANAAWKLGEELTQVVSLGTADPSEVVRQIIPGMTGEYPELVTVGIDLSWPPVESDEVNFCLRAEETWGACVSAGALQDSESKVELLIGVEPSFSGDIELWAMDKYPDLANPLLLITSFPVLELIHDQPHVVIAEFQASPLVVRLELT